MATGDERVYSGGVLTAPSVPSGRP
jgi:hypothetical protein